MGLEYFLRAINAGSEHEMLQVLDEFDRNIESARETARFSAYEPLVAAG